LLSQLYSDTGRTYNSRVQYDSYLSYSCAGINTRCCTHVNTKVRIDFFDLFHTPVIGCRAEGFTPLDVSPPVVSWDGSASKMVTNSAVSKRVCQLKRDSQNTMKLKVLRGHQREFHRTTQLNDEWTAISQRHGALLTARG